MRAMFLHKREVTDQPMAMVPKSLRRFKGQGWDNLLNEVE